MSLLDVITSAPVVFWTGVGVAMWIAIRHYRPTDSGRRD